jgi:hypothetical protein
MSRARGASVLDTVELLTIDRLAGRADDPGMKERAFMGQDRRIWLVRPRPTSRRTEAATHVTLELLTDGETRVVTCRYEEWDTPAPDFPSLLDRSLPGGASRGVGPRTEASPLEPD